MLIRFSLVMLVALSMIGCATTRPVETLPTDPGSFQLTDSELRESFPEIDEYEEGFRGFSHNIPPVEQLIDQWGEPDRKRKDYVYAVIVGATLVGSAFLLSPGVTLLGGGIMLAVRPTLPEYYYWIKGDYCIEVVVDATFDSSYEKVLSHWEWFRLDQDDDLPDECSVTPE